MRDFILVFGSWNFHFRIHFIFCFKWLFQNNVGLLADKRAAARGVFRVIAALSCTRSISIKLSAIKGWRFDLA
jgi:hypothetical protein